MKIITVIILTTGFNILHTQPSFAQKKEKTWTLEIGTALSVAPKYSGSSEYIVGIEPHIQGYYALSNTTTLALDSNSLSINYSMNPHLNIGLIGTYLNKRKSSDSDDLKGMQNINGTIEVGSYVEYTITPNISTSSYILFDSGDSHGGWHANANVNYHNQLGTSSWAYEINSSIDFGNKKFNNVYYGVKKSEATLKRRSFVADGGISSINFSAKVAYSLNQDWRIISSMNIQQLLNDAADSSIVKEKTQAYGSLGLIYEF